MLQLEKDKTYALAVSGGSDSMAMLEMFRQSGAAFFVVTVNHGLREKGASDAAFVQDFCAERGIRCLRFDLDVKGFAAKNKLSTETAARLLRYRQLDEAACDYVCLAHNKEDNAESVLMHLLRGSGTGGAVGMREKNGRYLRPLLSFTKQQLRDFCRENGVPYVTDETNAQTDFTRNFLRLKVFPLLQEVNSNAVDNLLRFAENAAEDDDFLNGLADISEVKFEENFFSVPVQLLRQPKPVAQRVLKKAFAAAGYPFDIEKVHFDGLLRLANAKGGKKFSLPFDLIAVNEYNSISIGRFGEKTAEYRFPFAEGVTETPFGRICVEKEPSAGALRFDLDKIPAGAVIRTTKRGDTFTKFGGGTKRLARYLTDRKIPARERENLLVVADGSDVLIVCGVEISEKVKVTEKARQYFIYKA